MQIMEPEKPGGPGDGALGQARAKARDAAPRVVDKLIAIIESDQAPRNAVSTVAVAKLLLDLAASESKPAGDEAAQPAPLTPDLVSKAESALEEMH